jgi:ATP-binding cassette subfamily C protein CydC
MRPEPATRLVLGLLRGRARCRLALALVLAVTAAASGIGLLGLAGWFLATCALAGQGLVAGFSYLYPSGGVRALALTRTTSRYLERLVGHRATLTVLTRLRVLVYAHAMRLDASRLRAMRRGDVLDRLLRDVEAVDLVLLRVVLPAGVAVIGAAGGLLVLTAVLPAAAGATLLGLAVVAAVLVGAHVHGRHGGRVRAAARGSLRARLVAAAEGRPELVCGGAAPYALADLTGRTDRWSRLARRAGLGEQVAVGAVRGVAGITQLAVLVLGLGGTSVPMAVLMALVVHGVFELAEPLPAAVVAAQEAGESLRRLDALRPAAVDPAAPAAGPGDLELRDASVRAGDRCLLEPVRLTVAAGELVVVTGTSGAGKTTLLRLLAGELAPTSGRVLVGGVDPTRLDPAARADLVVLVDADDTLFAGTVAENLRVGAPDAADPELAALLDACGLDDLTPDTPVGPRGNEVSGGQRRRLLVARAVLRRPAVLLLDEPTEGVDAPGARVLLAAVRARLPDATLLLGLHDRAVTHLPADTRPRRVHLPHRSGPRAPAAALLEGAGAPPTGRPRPAGRAAGGDVRAREREPRDVGHP